MNKSEIAERAAREIMSVWRGNVMPFNEKSLAAIVERAIAESQAPQPPAQFDEWWIALGWSLLGCPAKFSDKYIAAKVTFEAAKNFGSTPTNCTCNSDSVYCPFHKRDVRPIPSSFELGDGEPSPPLGICDDTTRGSVPHVQDIGCINWRSGAAQEVSPRARAMKIAKEIDQECIHQDDMGHTFEVSRAAAIIEKEYGVEEVSPPSPEPVCPMCCKPVFTDGYEGDTRELKAALKMAVEWEADYRKINNLCGPKLHWVIEAERLLEAK